VLLRLLLLLLLLLVWVADCRQDPPGVLDGLCYKHAKQLLPCHVKECLTAASATQGHHPQPWFSRSLCFVQHSWPKLSPLQSQVGSQQTWNRSSMLPIQQELTFQCCPASSEPRRAPMASSTNRHTSCTWQWNRGRAGAG
jgi:hypothetical protein